MKPFDVVLLAYIAFGTLRGWGRGLLAMAAGIGGFLVALLVARAGYRPLTAYLDAHVGFEKAVQSAMAGIVPAGTLTLPGLREGLQLSASAVAGALCFLALLFAAEALVGLIAGRFGSIPNHLPLVGPANRLLGAAFGLLESGAIAAVLLLLLEPLAKAGGLGGLSHYVTGAPIAASLWKLAQQFAPLTRALP